MRGLRWTIEALKPELLVVGNRSLEVGAYDLGEDENDLKLKKKKEGVAAISPNHFPKIGPPIGPLV